MALGITQNLKKSVLPADKKDIFNISTQIEENETTVNSDRGWEISDKIEEISVRGRLKENSHFWKNESKPALLVQNIIDNGYTMPFITIPRLRIWSHSLKKSLMENFIFCAVYYKKT